MALLPALLFSQEITLQPGDRFSIVSAEDPSLSVVRRVDQYGTVRLPRAGSVVIAGLTPDQARERIARQARLDPARLSLALLTSPDAPIRYRGAVDASGMVKARKGLRLADVVALASPTDAADLTAVQITSATGETITVDFYPEDPEGNPSLRPGDRVFFPISEKRSEIQVLGGVVKPGPVPYERQMTVGQAVAAAGGLRNHGNARNVQIVRGSNVVSTLELPRQAETPLRRGDTVVVPLDAQRRFVTVVGEVKSGGLIEWKEGMTLEQAIQGAGGLLPGAGPDRIRVQRLLGPKPFRRRVDLKTDAKMVIEANDVIQIPPKGAPIPRPVDPTQDDKGPRRVVPPE